MAEDRFIHTKRVNKAYNPRNFGRHYNQDQRHGNFSFDTIHGMKLKRAVYRIPTTAERKATRAAFDGIRGPNGVLIQQGIRSEFVKMLANDHEKELVEKLGLSERDLDSMRKGYVPNGFNVHHKLPVHGGGKNEFSNFILTPKYPHDQWHWDVLDPQVEGLDQGQSRVVWLPYTDEMIYDPKKYGFSKENQPALPNYVSNAKPENYDNLYKAEHISVAKREAAMKSYYANLDAKNKKDPGKKPTKPRRRLLIHRDRQRA